MKDPAVYEQRFSYDTSNIAIVKLTDQEIHLSLPSGCSTFILIGIITPISPPFPVLWFRAWHWGDHPCNYFVVDVGNNVKILLKVDGKIYQSIKTTNPYFYNKNNVRHEFPIPSKSIDSGSIIIEKDEKKIEIPFEYKYLRYWR